MNIDAINSYSGAGNTLPGNSGAELKNQFMTLMLAELQNQDPTEPMDSAKYVSQLAEFSQVESLENVRSNQLMHMEMLESATIVQSASLIGKTALVPANELTLDGEVVNGKLFLDQSAEQVTVDILDQMGQVVSSVNLGAKQAGDNNFVLDPDTLDLPRGQYSLKVTAHAGENTTSPQLFLAGEIERIHFVSASGMMMAQIGNGLGTVSVLEISEVANATGSTS